jgi:hypothetical protein
MSKRNRTGPVCHRVECKEERLRFYTDSTLACPVCGSCGGHKRTCDPVARFYTRTKKNGECIEWATTRRHADGAQSARGAVVLDRARQVRIIHKHEPRWHHWQ